MGLMIFVQALSVESLYDIKVVGALVYGGDDPAGKHYSTLFTGSDVVRELLENNSVNVQRLLAKLQVAFKLVHIIIFTK